MTFRPYGRTWRRLVDLLCCSWLCCHAVAQEKSFVIAELNAENLFDCAHDEGYNDHDFLPDSGRRWHQGRLWHKLQHLSKEIMSLNGLLPPDLVALTEVENDSVLHGLTRRAILRRAGYHYVMTHSHDERGLDVALLYQPLTFRVIGHESITPHLNGTPILTRDILHIVGCVVTGDTLHVYVCHFSSKIGGRKAQRYRMAEARTLWNSVNDVLRHGREAKIVIVGDFNDAPSSKALTVGLKVQMAAEAGSYLPQRLYNLSQSLPSDSIRGTYKYDGRWELLDQCIVSGSLLSEEEAFSVIPGSFRVCSPSFLLERDDEGLGLKPRRTYNGFRYNGGFSDHLPILVKFSQRFSSPSTGR
ncbi:MAG: endonuclease [Bacteroidaceae bacterium]|nr:endonuclease [Bacteroidaceae bacterium]